MLPRFVSRAGKLLAGSFRRVFGSFREVFARDEFGVSFWEIKRLEHSPRFLHTHAPLLGKRIALTDPSWYLFSYREIFRDEIYRFEIGSPSPLIIDCGANIGLSVIYFKHLYPDARIVAFEPDGEIFRILEQNLKTFQLKNISLYSKAVWSSETELSFQPDGGVGGKLVENTNAGIRVKTVRLKDFLNQKVDFLKIDIEGAEYEVLKDCKDYLGNVNYLFVEHHGIKDAEETLNEILEIMRNAGFHYHMKESYPIRHPFIPEERNIVYPLLLNIFAFRNSN
jgi:FkbM family methyltransferase